MVMCDIVGSLDMNTALLTGYLPNGAAVAYAPGGRKFLVFEVVVCGDDSEVPWRCEIGDAALVEQIGAKLSAGRGVVLSARLCAKPFMAAGRQTGWTRYLEVTAVELVRSDQSRQLVAPAEEANP